MTMPAYMSALALVKAEYDLAGGSHIHWPGLNLDGFEHITKAGYGTFRNVMTIGEDMPIELTLDNRRIALHATGIKAGNGAQNFLFQHWLAIEQRMLPVPGFPFYRYMYADGGFRLGYARDERVAVNDQDMKIFGIYRALTCLMRAVNDHCLFVRNLDLSGSHFHPNNNEKIGFLLDREI